MTLRQSLWGPTAPTQEMQVLGFPLPVLASMVYWDQRGDFTSDYATLMRVDHKFAPAGHRRNPDLTLQGDWPGSEWHGTKWLTEEMAEISSAVTASVLHKDGALFQTLESRYRLGEVCKIGEPHVVDGDKIRYSDGAYVPIPAELQALYPESTGERPFRKSKDLPLFAVRLAVQVAAVRPMFLRDLGMPEWYALYRGNCDRHLIPTLWHAVNYNFDWAKNWALWLYRVRIVYRNPNVCE